MKTLLLSALLLATATSAFAQGFLIFQNSSTTTITNYCTGLPAEGGPAQDDTQVGLYLGTVGTPVGSLQLVAQTNFNNPGRFSGGTRQIDTVAPGQVTVQVRAWLAATVYPSYEAAAAAGLGGDGSVFLGGSTPFNMTMVGVGGVPLSIAANGLTPFSFGPLTCVPEPSMVALGLVGLVVAAMLRLRK